MTKSDVHTRADPSPTAAPRVAFFPDTYDEIDGVANTARQFVAFARRKGLPFLTVCGGEQNDVEQKDGLKRIILRRGRIGFPVDKRHNFDLAFWRHYSFVEAELRKFAPHVVHITGPSDVGQLAALLAHKLRVPLVASWHTNLHEYAEQRATSLLRWLPEHWRTGVGTLIRKLSLRALMRFYKIPRLLFAPNQELIDLLEQGTGKTCYRMERGVDTVLFDPARRNRCDAGFILGYVGRITTEKNVRFLADVEKALTNAGESNFRFSIVGQGAEQPMLKAAMHHAEFPGVLRGEALANAYANMDLFVFPSRTDTYGNVVLEALASGVPAIVTSSGGPRFIVRPGETGFVADDLEAVVSHIKMLMRNGELLAKMRAAARRHALKASWGAVFDFVYAQYDQCLRDWASGKNIALGVRSITTGLPNSRQSVW